MSTEPRALTVVDELPLEMAMTSADVREALLGRFPADQYLTIHEAPEGSGRDGRKLDALVLSLWRSRGLSLDGIEIKVSVSDFRREIKDPTKADWWWEHCDRFWIAAPNAVAAKIKNELPPAWGLLSCTRSSVRQMVPAPTNQDRKPIPWPTLVGLFRASADAGINALQRAQRKGFDEGMERAKSMPQWNADTSSSWEVQQVRSDFEALRDSVRSFEEAAGIKIDRWRSKELGAVVRIVNEAVLQGPDTIAKRLDREAESLRGMADVTDKLAVALRAGFGVAGSTNQEPGDG
jgi:hypothetical protein